MHQCVLCKKEEFGNVFCEKGHYVCDHCHGEALFQQILKSAIRKKEKDPLEIAESILKEVSIPMLGCEHAWIGALSLLCGMKNQGLLNINKEMITEVLQRTRRQAIGAYCGLTGVCGIAPGIGAVFSVLLGASCPKNQETKKTMEVVAKVIEGISKETGPCCCKNFLYTGLKIASEHTEKCFGIPIKADYSILCRDSQRHPHGCRKELCMYYDKTAS